MTVRCCGPNVSICCAVISAWGIVMLGLLGIFFFVQAPALVDDLPIDEAAWALQDHRYDYIEDLYKQNAINCWIATGLYVVTFIISVVMYKVNQRTSFVQA